MKPHTFSVRLPEDMVIEISRMARESKRDRNPIIVELLTLGLGRSLDFDKAVRDFVFRKVTAQELVTLETGL